MHWSTCNTDSNEPVYLTDSDITTTISSVTELTTACHQHIIYLTTKHLQRVDRMSE